MKTYSVCWYDAKAAALCATIEAKSMKRATEWGRSIAKERGIRLVSVREGIEAFSGTNDTHSVISDI